MDSVTTIKLISALLYPMGLVFLFAVLGIFGRLVFQYGWLRLFANISCFLSVGTLVLFSNPMVANSLVQSLEEQYPQLELNEIERHDVVIVLGGGLRVPIYPAKHPQLTSGSDRYWYATRLFRAGKAKEIIVTGGNVYEQLGLKGEAYYAGQLMREWIVPSSAIIIEDQSRTTEQNRDNTARLIQEKGYSSALLVTSALHMPRAYQLFSSLPIKVTPASADVLILEREAPEVFSWMPSSNAMALSKAALHEYYGKWFADLKALIFNG